MDILAKKIKHFKVQLNLTNEKLAEMTGLPTNTIARICSGRTKDPTRKTLKKLANALNCTLDDLLGYDEDNLVEPYYLDRKTGELAQALKDNAELKILFDATRDLSPDDIKTVIGMINMMKGRK